VTGRQWLSGWLGCTALVAVSAVVHALASYGVNAPWIAPDEPTYGLIGRSLWATGQLTIAGAAAPFYGIVYPAFAGAPLHVLGTVDAIRVLQVLQAVVMASTGLVVYAWARTLMAERHALLAAVLTLALPAFIYSGFVMTEPVYYPIATLALWSIGRALERPTLERQAVAVTAILVTALTRLQGLALLPGLVAAVLAVAVFERSLRIVRRFALTLALTIVAGAVVVVLHQTGGSGDLLGAYSTTAQTSYELGPSLRWILWHGGDVFLLVGGAPLLAFAVLAVDALRGRERDPAVRALLAVGLAYVAVTVVQVGVFASRFAGVLAERNLITVAPPLFVAFALWLGRGAPRPRLSLLLGSVAVALPALALQTSKLTDPSGRPSGLTAAPFDHLLGWLSAGWVRGVWTLAVLIVAILFAGLPRRLMPGLAALSVALLVGSSAVASIDVHRLARGLRHQLFGDADRAWVDRSAAGAVAYFDGGGHYWNQSWMTVFWNRRIVRVVALPDPDLGGIPPHEAVSPRYDGLLLTATGEALGEPYVVAPERFTLLGTPVTSITTGTDAGRLTLWKVDPPARLTMMRSGFQPNGDIEQSARVEVFACTPGRLDVTLLGKDGSPVLLGVEGGVTRRYTTAGKDVVHASVPSPLGTGETGRCRFWIETPGLVGTTTITFVPAT
jgi:hypothetical protein